ncbi:MAG: hypothetical protein EOP37_04400 [Rubrivivax sp.]|nr:MAG: hypothetical protein EOP37_04400 [Rubrivivax sp.]
MYHYAHPQPFDVMPTPFQGGLANNGFNPFVAQPWPALAPGILEINLLSLAAAAAGQWLAGIVPPLLNATMTPAFQGFPPLMQAALPLSQPDMDPRGAIAFATALGEGGITDLIVAEGQVPGPLLARLRMPGQSQGWQVPGPDGQPVTATFHRVDAPTDDGSWLLQADVSHGGQMMSSQLVRMHEAIADPRRPQLFREGVARGHASWTGQCAAGQDARMAVVCEDGARRSGAAAVLLRQLSQEQAHESGWGSDESASPDQLRRANNEFIRACAGSRGPAFAENQEMFLKAGLKRSTERASEGPDEYRRTGSPPPQSLFQSPFCSLQRRAAAVSDSGVDSQSDVDTDDDADSASCFSLSSAGDAELDARPGDERLAEFDDHTAAVAPEPSNLDKPIPDARALPPPSTPGSKSLNGAKVSPQDAVPRAPASTPVPAPASALSPGPGSDVLLTGLRAAMPAQKGTISEEARLLTRLPEAPTHDPAAADRAAELLKERKIMATMARLPKPPAGQPRSRSAPDLSQVSKEAEATTTRALAQARSASEPDLRKTPPARPLQETMGSLFREIDASLGLRQRMKRSFTFNNGNARALDQVTERMRRVVDQLRRVHEQRAGADADAGAEAGFIVENLARSADHAFKALTLAAQLRLADAFHGNGGQLAALRGARDDLLKTMTRLSDTKSGVPGTLGPDFAVAQRKHEALNYTIAALEFAVPSTGGPVN